MLCDELVCTQKPIDIRYRRGFRGLKNLFEKASRGRDRSATYVVAQNIHIRRVKTPRADIYLRVCHAIEEPEILQGVIEKSSSSSNVEIIQINTDSIAQLACNQGVHRALE